MARAAAAPSKIVVRPKLVAGKDEIAKAFHLYCANKGIALEGKRMPRNTIPKFISECLTWRTKECVRALANKVRTWHTKWQECGKGLDMSLQSRAPKQNSAVRKKERSLRQRREGAGAKHRAVLVRQSLYEW